MMTPEDQVQAMFAGSDPRRPRYKEAQWPTPTKQDGENCAGPSQLDRNSDPLNVAVLRGQPCQASGQAALESRSTDGSLGELLEDWPTPASNGGTGGCVGLAGGAGNRAKLYRPLGDVEGRKMGCQKLNPHWVFCLMGYPPLWAELGNELKPGRPACALFWLREQGRKPVPDTFKEHLDWKQSYLSSERFAIRREALRVLVAGGQRHLHGNGHHELHLLGAVLRLHPVAGGGDGGFP
jgi:hypothetical protein